MILSGYTIRGNTLINHAVVWQVDDVTFYPNLDNFNMFPGIGVVRVMSSFEEV